MTRDEAVAVAEAIALADDDSIDDICDVLNDADLGWLFEPDCDADDPDRVVEGTAATFAIAIRRRQ